MKPADHDVVTLGADVGGRDADLATSEDLLAFGKLLRSTCRGPYSETMLEVALILRIDGSVQAWGKRGVEGVRLGKRNAYATADIYVPREVWMGQDGHEFRHFIAKEARVAVAEIADLAARRRVDLARDALERDVGLAAEAFLAS